MSASGILTPNDEFQYWVEVVGTGKKGEERDRAAYFSDLFQSKIAPQFATLLTLSMSAVMDLVEDAQDTLDDVWKQTDFDKPYPEPRMRRLLDVIGENISDSMYYFVCHSPWFKIGPMMSNWLVDVSQIVEHRSSTMRSR